MRRIGWLITLLFPALLGAQRVRGIVVDSALNSPLSGVVVLALDSANQVGARTITDGQGRFNLGVPASVPKLRLMRIGFRMRDVAIGADRNAELRYSMQRIPPILDAVRVSDKEVCPGSPDRGAAFQLWDQARAGLLAAIVAREAKPATTQAVVYKRTVSPSDEIVRKQTKLVKTGRTTNPFVAAASPAAFARVGYMLEDSRGRDFSAPDADVLLHETFALAHCFRLRQADDAHRGQIGVAFVPAPGPGRDTLVDVSGVLWMDAASPQLRTLDYLYTALEPAAMAARAGGHIQFRNMENGVAFIERWVIRMPIMEMAASAQTLPGNMIVRRPTSNLRSARTNARVTQIDETGGIVLTAAWDDGTRWEDPPSIIAGTVKGRRSNTPIADAVVSLEGTDDSTTTDVGGEFHLETIPGRYFMRVADTAFRDFTKERTTSQLISVTQGKIEITRIEMPPTGDVLEDICKGRRNPIGSLNLAGYVAASDASSVNGARVQASWTQVANDPVHGRMPTPETQILDVKDEGRFILCGVPPRRPIQVELYKGKTKVADTTLTLMTVAPTHRLMWVVPPLSAPRAATPPTATVQEMADSTPRELSNTISAAERLAAFHRHVATQLGTYLADSALSSVRGRPLVDALPQLVKTLRIWRVDGQAFVVSPSRDVNIPGFQSTSRCLSDVYVNGARRWASYDFGKAAPLDLSSYSADAIAAVEFYDADTRVPDGLQVSACGVLVLWLK